MISNTEISAFDFKESPGDHLDVAFVPNMAKRQSTVFGCLLKYVSLYTGKLCCVMKNDHRLSCMELVTFSDLEGVKH